MTDLDELRAPPAAGGSVAPDRLVELLDTVDAVRALHQPATAYTHEDLEAGEWLDSIEAVRDALAEQEGWLAEEERIPWDGRRGFVKQRVYCRHCQPTAEKPIAPWEAALTPEAAWPCPTVRTLPPSTGGRQAA